LISKGCALCTAVLAGPEPPKHIQSVFNVSSYTLNMKIICDAWVMRTHIREFKKKILGNFFITFGPFYAHFRQVLAVFSY
jgi:hypothetical protein